MDNMSPQQQQQDGGQQVNKRRMKSQSYRRQSAPSLVLSKALTRSKTLSRDSFLPAVCPEKCPLVQSFLTGSDRVFLLHGHVQLKTGMQTQDRHLFLFTDILVIAKAKSANHYKQKAQVRVCEMWTASCIDEVCEGSTNPETSFVMGWPTCNSVASFSSAEQKEKWLSVLRSRIKEEKESEEPKTIPLRVYGKGINTFAVTKTLPVSNWDSTNEVVRLALQQFSIIGNVKDFQLWVISKRDTIPYPLIGHEFPFSIQMSHVRHSMSQGSGGDGAVDGQVAIQVEQLQVYKQCQFILKPRPTETPNAELLQKPLKRSRSFINWAFWRGSSPHLNELSIGAARGCLFGQPLSTVCIEDALPKPVMDMLTFLYCEGSWTRGIFRRSAGARAVRELRESLDSGQFQLPLSRDHVFVIAGVFKDFLRRIPGSLLCCELHEEWVDLLEEDEEEEEQVQEVKSMMSRLPKENGLLLRYLLAMLHGVQSNAQENQMTSFNLSVCIAPSMLWPPGAPRSSEAEGEGTKKVCELVKFMIEHCQQILGEDPSSLFGGPPQRLKSDEMGSDSCLYPLTDSSYDSLENGLDNSSGSPGFCSSNLLRPKTLRGSLDSILTFSDYDQDTDPEGHQAQTDLKFHPLGRSRARRQKAELSQGPQTTGTSFKPDSLSLDGQRRQRRCSEPAVAYLAKFGQCTLRSTGGLTVEDEDGEEELSKKHSCYMYSGETKKNRDESTLTLPGVRSAVLEASPTSPEHTRSSLDTPNSLGSERPWVRRRGLYAPKTQVPSSSSCVTSTPSTINAPDPGTSLKGSPPKEPLNWGPLKSCQGLHPNSWLKKNRRLSLTQQEKLEIEDEDKCGGGSSQNLLILREHVPEKGKASEREEGTLISSNQSKTTASKDAGGGHVSLRPGQESHKSQPLKQDSSSPPLHHRSTGSLHFPKPSWFHSSDSLLTVRQLRDHSCPAASQVKQVKQSSPSLFYKQSGSSLTLFRQSNTRLHQRRRSEPGRQVMERTSLTRARLPSDPGLKDTTTEAHFCLSPHATKAVRDYFCSHPNSNPHSSQQVAVALVESHRELLKRCSDPTAEPDFDQLLFAEESFV